MQALYPLQKLNTLTRAVHACHVFAVPAPAEDMRGGRQQKAGADRSPLDILLARIGGKRADTLARIEWREGWASEPGARYQVAGVEAIVREAREMPQPPATPLPSRHSFSSLNRGHHAGDAAAEAAADDETASPIDAAAGESDDIITATPEAEHPVLLALRTL